MDIWAALEILGELADRTQTDEPVEAWRIVNDFVTAKHASARRPEDPEPPTGKPL